MDAILRIDDEARIFFRRFIAIDHFINTRWTIEARRLAIFWQIVAHRCLSIFQLQMHRLVFFMIGR